jgi:hypothetical protein
MIAMGRVNVKNGTPMGNEPLCRSCAHGQYTTGYRESEVLVICANASPARLVPFSVYECTDYWDRNRPGYEEMTKLALNLGDGRRKRIRGFGRAGFAVVRAPVDKREEKDEDEAASSN